MAQINLTKMVSRQKLPRKTKLIFRMPIKLQNNITLKVKGSPYTHGPHSYPDNNLKISIPSRASNVLKHALFPLVDAASNSQASILTVLDGESTPSCWWIF